MTNTDKDPSFDNVGTTLVICGKVELRSVVKMLETVFSEQISDEDEV